MILLAITVTKKLDHNNSNVGFYEAARKIVQMCKKDYSLLIGESVRITKNYRETPVDVDALETAKMSSDVQGISKRLE